VVFFKSLLDDGFLAASLRVEVESLAEKGSDTPYMRIEG
jgi:hypothetical protein